MWQKCNAIKARHSLGDTQQDSCWIVFVCKYEDSRTPLRAHSSVKSAKDRESLQKPHRHSCSGMDLCFTTVTHIIGCVSSAVLEVRAMGQWARPRTWRIRYGSRPRMSHNTGKKRDAGTPKEPKLMVLCRREPLWVFSDESALGAPESPSRHHRIGKLWN